MNPLEFIFLLIERYVPVNPGRFQAIKNEASTWYYGGVDPKTGEKSPAQADTTRFGKMIKERGEMWYWQLGLAFAFIFVAKMFHDIMSNKPKDEVTL